MSNRCKNEIFFLFDHVKLLYCIQHVCVTKLAKLDGQFVFESDYLTPPFSPGVTQSGVESTAMSLWFLCPTS